MASRIVYVHISVRVSKLLVAQRVVKLGPVCSRKLMVVITCLSQAICQKYLQPMKLCMGSQNLNSEIWGKKILKNETVAGTRMSH